MEIIISIIQFICYILPEIQPGTVHDDVERSSHRTNMAEILYEEEFSLLPITLFLCINAPFFGLILPLSERTMLKMYFVNFLCVKFICWCRFELF